MSTTDQLRNAVTPAKPQAAVPDKDKPKGILTMLTEKEFKEQLAIAVPKAMNAERLVRIVLTECRKVPELRQTTPESFLGAVLQCAQLGLEPGSALGHCYLLPYWDSKEGVKNCQLIIGYRGMIDLARRSGQIVSICAYTVHEKDHFEWRLGLDPNIEHVPSPEANRGPMTYVYAVAKLKGGGVQFEVMSRAEVEAIREKSKGSKSQYSPWVTHFVEMAKKTVIRRLFKYLPVSIEAARAVEVDERADRGAAVTPQDFIDVAYEDLGTEVPPDAVTVVDGTTGEIVEDVPTAPEE